MKRLLTGFVLLSILFTCTEEETTSRQYPRVRTNPVSNITSVGAIFSGEIYFSPGEIIDHGFIWSTSKTLTLSNSEQISLGGLDGLGVFETLTERSLAEGKKYYVKAYAQSLSHLVYGEVVEFVSLGSKAPVLSKIQPTVGTWGDTVTLVGLNFSSVISSNTVAFGGQEAQVIYATQDTLKALVPSALVKDKSDVSISFDENVSVLVNAFELLPPEINSISPAEGSSDMPVEIVGDYFNPETTKVLFGAKEAKINLVNKTKIICEVPSGLPFGVIQVIVQTGEGQLFTSEDFFVQTPRIYRLVPAVASVSETIKIEGDFFGSGVESNIVRFDNEQAQIVSATKTQIEVIVPFYINTVKPKISVTYNGSKDESIGVFSIRPPEILSYSTHFAGSNEALIIYGNHFNPYITNQVYLGDEQLIVDAVSFTEIYARWPYYLNTNSLPLKVTWNEQEVIGNEPVKSNWIRLEDSPEYFSQSISLVHDEKAYIGLDGAYPASDVIWEYNPTTKNWTEFTNFPGGPRSGSISFVVGSKAYIGGGYSAFDPTQNFNDFWSFDFNAKTWTQLSSLPFSTNIFGFALGNKGYAIEYMDSEESKLWAYNVLDDEWMEENPSLDFNVYYATGFNGIEVNGFFYLFDLFLNLRQFNPANGQWQVISGVPNSDNYNNPVAFSFALNNSIYSGTRGGELWKLNPITQEWTDAGKYMGEMRYEGIGFSANGKGYVISGNTTKTCLEFDPNY